MSRKYWGKNMRIETRQYKLYKFEELNDEAKQRDLAIDWQQWQAEHSLSYGEIVYFQNYFERLATKLDLTDEFKENGII